jgi:hypothetical protein
MVITSGFCNFFCVSDEESAFGSKTTSVPVVCTFVAVSPPSFLKQFPAQLRHLAQQLRESCATHLTSLRLLPQTRLKINSFGFGMLLAFSQSATQFLRLNRRSP